jgi:hypothetical protein
LNARWRFFLRCGGVKNEHDGDHYLETHSLLTSSSNNTHREWLRSLFGISCRARDNGVSLEMRWRGDTITRSVNQWWWWRHNYRFTCSHLD